MSSETENIKYCYQASHYVISTSNVDFVCLSIILTEEMSTTILGQRSDN